MIDKDSDVAVHVATRYAFDGRPYYDVTLNGVRLTPTNSDREFNKALGVFSNHSESLAILSDQGSFQFKLGAELIDFTDLPLPLEHAARYENNLIARIKRVRERLTEHDAKYVVYVTNDQGLRRLDGEGFHSITVGYNRECRRFVIEIDGTRVTDVNRHSIFASLTGCYVDTEGEHPLLALAGSFRFGFPKNSYGLDSLKVWVPFNEPSLNMFDPDAYVSSFITRVLQVRAAVNRARVRLADFVVKGVEVSRVDG